MEMEIKEKLKNINELARNIGSMDRAIEVPLLYSEDMTQHNIDNWKGVLNVETNKVAQIVSKNYQIIQHNDVLQAVTEALTTKNIEISGRLDNYRDSFRADLIFENQGIPVQDDATGLKIGIRVLNSYNKSSSFRLELFAFRMVCQNGMSLGNVMNNVRELTFHTGEEKPLQKIREITEKFLIRAINSSKELQTYVSAAMIDSVAYNEAMEIVKKLISATKHRKTIAEILGFEIVELVLESGKKEIQFVPPQGKKLTRWDLYNALTNYATHYELNRNVEEYIQNNAQKILNNSVEKLVEISTN